ncbi:asparagine synthase C-terminal domain-containing protein [Candidatus Nitrosotalea okcheonensis]|uniref:Asparagine synthase n=1 Tax=Candidatus Nitrosotalea okcheonensis TaxID=1903276 RepID=A0A2H1FFZ8_9ARCH|nr:asparagine synthase-related protein [Candidatus Nitrosotalea okcheonensis]SMH71690.1 Asparagine synthase [Candidatus Nitrosotalea okcheonensis]
MVPVMPELEKELHTQMVQAIEGTKGSGKIGISFSGGVDSCLLAKICQDLGYNVLLFTMGFEGSHDVEFSRRMAKVLGMNHEIEIISEKTFGDVAKKIWDEINVDNLSWNENCIAFYYVAKLAQKHKVTKVMTANGIDELFCGYNAYRDSISEGKDMVLEMMEDKILNETRMMKAVNQIVSEFGVSIVQPFLSKEFIGFAKLVPLEYKIKGKDDLVRKHLIRKLAVSIGVPEESALKLKKAMQYGSLIHKNLLKVKKTWNMNF